MRIEDRVQRMVTASHIVYTGDMTVYVIADIEITPEDIYVHTSDGMIFRDEDVFTLEEAAHMERSMLNIYKEFGIKYND